MANIFVNLPAVANAAGANVDTSQMGKDKSLIVSGAFTGTLIVEASNDGGTVFAPVKVVSRPGVYPLEVAAGIMRVRSSGATVSGFAPQLDMGANDDGVLLGVVPAPAAANATGAPLDVAAFGDFYTIIVGGNFSGVIVIQASEDGVDWADVATFQSRGALPVSITANEMRAVSRGAVAAGFAPTISLAAATDAAAAASSMPRSAFVYAPGGVAVDNVYTDWDALMAAMGQVQGPKVLEFRDEFVSPCPIPVGGPYPMDDVRWWATRLHAADGQKVLIDVIEGVTFSKLRWLSGELEVDVRASATPPDDTLSDNEIIRITDGAQIEREVPGAVAMWSGANLVATDAVTLYVDNSAAVLGPGPIVDMPIAATTLRVNVLVNGQCEADVVSGDVGATLFVFLNASTALFNWTQPGWLGTVIDFPLTNLRMLIDEAPAATNQNLTRNEIGRFDTTAAPRVANLPTAASMGRGQFVGVVNEAGANNVVATATGGDTVNGGATNNVLPGTAALFVSDGISAWFRIG